MKNQSSVFAIVILSLLIALAYLLYKCPKKNTTILFNDKHVKGEIISMPRAGEIGFVELGITHTSKFLALVEAGDISTKSLYDEVKFKVKLVDGIPLAYDFKDQVSDSEIYTEIEFDTPIRYHSFNIHGQNRNLHTFGHIVIGGERSLGTSSITNSLYEDSGKYYLIVKQPASSALDTLQLRKSDYERVKTFTSGGIYYETRKLSRKPHLITQIDTVHRHGERIVITRKEIEGKF